MPRNPVLAYAAPGAPSQAMTLTLFSGASVTVRGVAGDAETSVGEVDAAWSQSGPAVWIAWGGDPKEIETVQYHDAQTDRTVVRRATFSERVAGALGWDTIRIVLSILILAVVATGGPDFDILDFDPLDFRTG